MSNPLTTLAHRSAPTAARPDHGPRDTILASIIVGVFAVVVTFSQPASASGPVASCDRGLADRSACASTAP